MLTIKLTAYGIEYVGTLAEDNTFQGTFTQMGQKLDLNLTKKEE